MPTHLPIPNVRIGTFISQLEDFQHWLLDSPEFEIPGDVKVLCEQLKYRCNQLKVKAEIAATNPDAGKLGEDRVKEIVKDQFKASWAPEVYGDVQTHPKMA